MKYMIPELFTLSLLLSLVEKDKWRTALEWVFIILLGLLSTVEVWLSNHFNLPLSYQAIQLLMETNPRESSEFFHGFVLHSFSDWLWQRCCICFGRKAHCCRCSANWRNTLVAPWWRKWC